MERANFTLDWIEVGPVTARAPRARLKTSDGKTAEWKNKTIPAYLRRTKKADALIAGSYRDQFLQDLASDQPLLERNITDSRREERRRPGYRP